MLCRVREDKSVDGVNGDEEYIFFKILLLLLDYMKIT